MNFVSYFKTRILLKEGGNAFTGTRRITKDEIFATIKHLEKALNYPLVKNLLGSTGKAPDSGDVDVVIDSKILNKKAVESAALTFVNNDKSSIRIIGNAIHVKSPIWDKTGTKTSDFVQVDLNVSDSPEYLKWFFASNETLPLKGKDRNILLSSVCKNKGYAISTLGLRDRVTKATVSKDPNQIAKLLFGKQATKADIHNVPKIISKMKEVFGEEKAKLIASEAEYTTGNSYF